MFSLQQDSYPLLRVLVGFREMHFVDMKHNFICVTEVCKGKAIPLQPWRGPDGSRSLRLPDFKTIGT
jgi:hypothetical protein